MRTLHIAAALLIAALSAPAGDDPLPSWNDGKPKQAILDFVAKVTKEGGEGWVPPAERIAVFDNDGTLWAEQPVYFQVFFALDRIEALSAQHPEWKEQEPYASLLKRDLRGAIEKSGLRGLEGAILASHGGMHTDEFEQIVRGWVATATHPVTKRPFTSMVYQPMLELLAWLRANGFKTFIVSGGGVEFMRGFAEKVYGIPPEQVIGSCGKQKLEFKDGKPVLLKLPEIEFVDDGPGKALAIQRVIGRKPIAAFGNSDGDLEMLMWTDRGERPRLCMYVSHDDAEREWAYGADSPIGKLERGLDHAKARAWPVVSMKADWNKIYPEQK